MSGDNSEHNARKFQEKHRENNKFWEELIAYFPLIPQGTYRK
jgi:hypothetical protein